MRKDELQSKTDAVINETKAAKQTMYDALNNGQQKKIAKNEDLFFSSSNTNKKKTY